MPASHPRVLFFASVLPIAWLLEEAPAYLRAATEGDCAPRALCDLSFGLIFVSAASSWLARLASPRVDRRGAITLVARLCSIGLVAGCLLVLDGVSDAHAVQGDLEWLFESHDGDVHLRAFRAGALALATFLSWSLVALARRRREGRSVLLWMAPAIHLAGLAILVGYYFIAVRSPLAAGRGEVHEVEPITSPSTSVPRRSGRA